VSVCLSVCKNVTVNTRRMHTAAVRHYKYDIMATTVWLPGVQLFCAVWAIGLVCGQMYHSAISVGCFFGLWAFIHVSIAIRQVEVQCRPISTAVLIVCWLLMYTQTLLVCTSM